MPPLPGPAHIRRHPPSIATRRPRWAWVALLACAAARDGSGTTPRVTVQASPRFEDVRREPTASGLTLRVRLVDDVGNPLAEKPVALERGGQTALAVTPCASTARAAGGSFATDAAGEVCLTIAQARGAAELVLRFPGDALYLPVEARVALQPGSAELRLAFEAPSLELDLDVPEQRVTLEWSGPGADTATLPRIALQLEEGGRARTIDTLDWERQAATLRARIASTELGAAGPARLLARASGSGDAPPIVAEAVVLRSATVRLERERLSATRDVLELEVAATSAAGVPSGGWVELRGAQQSLGSSPLAGGAARLQLALTADTPRELEVRYHADDPWWLPGEPLVLDLADAGDSQPARWPWLALLAPIGYVCVRALQRPAPRRPRSVRRPPPRPVTVAGATPAAPPAPISGWAGTVTDAHDGRPIAGARITALLPSLREESPSVSTTSDTEGYFVLPSLREPIPEGAQLRVSSRLHSDLHRPLPPQGRVSVVLTLRKRALLERLIRWARAAGPPWHRAAEPTPGEVVDVALRRGDRETALWAEGIQMAAFAGADVDEQHEAALRAREPAWQQSGAHPERHGSD